MIGCVIQNVAGAENRSVINVQNFRMVNVNTVLSQRLESADDRWIRKNKNRITIWRKRKPNRGFPVGRYLVIGRGLNGWAIYNRKLEKPLLDREFEDVQSAMWFAEMLEKVYINHVDDYLGIITEKEWDQIFFSVTQHSINEAFRLNPVKDLGTVIYLAVEKIKSKVGLITGKELHEYFRSNT